MSKAFKYYGGEDIKFADVLKEIEIIRGAKKTDKTKDAARIDDALIRIDKNGKRTSIYCAEQGYGQGAEGAVFDIAGGDGTSVLKIYFEPLRTKVREEKISLMVSNPIEDPRICWPNGIVYHNDEFVGFTMPKASGIKIPMNTKPAFVNTFNNDKRVLVKFFINLLEIFEILEKHNVVMGDLNLENFLLDANYEPILIDLDGAQVERSPCVVCVESFNAPEVITAFQDADQIDYEMEDEEPLANRYYGCVYSTFDRDRYSLVSLLFRMFMICRHPYIIPGENTLKSLANFNFIMNPSRMTKQMRNNTKTQWIELLKRWSHLPFFIREIFHKSFTTDNPANRFGPSDLKKRLEHYLDILKNGKLEKKDPDCKKIDGFEEIELSPLNSFKFNVSSIYLAMGFSILDSVKKAIKKGGENSLLADIDSTAVANILKNDSQCGFEDSISFSLLFNIGVFSIVQLEVNS